MKKYVILLLLLVSIMFPPNASAQSSNEILRANLLQQISTLLEQIKMLQQLPLERQSDTTFSSIILSPEAFIEVQYKVYDPSSFAWVKDLRHRELIERFIELSPDKFDEYFEEVVVFLDKKQDIDAYVETLNGTGSWRVGFSTYFVKSPIEDDGATELLVHELGHVISYEEENGETYLKLFEEEFWNGKEHEFGFVNDYARQSAEEDFAESFMKFVVEDYIYQGRATEKINFFDRYDNINKYRVEIRLNI